MNQTEAFVMNLQRTIVFCLDLHYHVVCKVFYDLRTAKAKNRNIFLFVRGTHQALTSTHNVFKDLHHWRGQPRDVQKAVDFVFCTGYGWSQVDGEIIGFIRVPRDKLQSTEESMYTIHCILCQEVLCAKAAKLGDDMQVTNPTASYFIITQFGRSTKLLVLTSHSIVSRNYLPISLNLA